ncbi:gamma-glutamyltransferase family protein, partial [Zavarzinia sp.]|uniref:gamma-glutamyltransferase family protein n=1 Tax=Zavarzinia sp. TaxID=2027920 RepID=UPI0035644E23
MRQAVAALALLAASAFAGLQAHAEQAADPVAPEASSGTVATAQSATARRYMVVAAHPAAARAGEAVLARGGSAVDALVAVQMVLGLVEPQSSGLGGGGFLVHWSAADGIVTSYDGRETAPAEVGSDLFLGPDGKPLSFFEAVVGGRSVGTPATVRLMAEAHAKYGRLPWAELLAPAIELAEKGFPVSPRLADLIAAEGPRLKTDPEAAAYFFDADGKPRAAGTILHNPAYAATLRAIAAGGPDAFYSGEIAAAVVAKVRGAGFNPGHLTTTDLAHYTVVERPALCGPALGHRLCGMGPPSSGTLAILQILNLIEPYGIEAKSPAEADTWRLIGDATRLAFADRERWLGDPDRLSIPLRGLLAPGYLALRGKL